jgi:hypothetical protein
MEEDNFLYCYIEDHNKIFNDIIRAIDSGKSITVFHLDNYKDIYNLKKENVKFENDKIMIKINNLWIDTPMAIFGIYA